MAGSPSKTLANLVELLAENPYWTIKGVSPRLGVAYTTAQRAVEKLASLSILTQVTEAKRFRVYCARHILEIR